jgi:hypothetical protein
MRWSLAVALTTASVSLAALPAHADSAPQDPSDPATPPTVTADALPTVQIDGVVWSQAIAGDRVYAGGDFHTARPAGSPAGVNTVPRENMLAYDLSSGELVASFAPSFNGQVRTVAVSPDGSVVYVGGEFTSVDGVRRDRIAALDASTGELVEGFAPPVNYTVRAIVATDTTVYAAGNFWAVGDQERGRFAAFRASDGALLDWAPQADSVVWAMALSPDGTKIAVGGQFSELNGSSDPGYGLGMLDAVTGENLPMAVNSVVRNAGSQGAVTTLTSDDEYVYGGGYTFGRSGGTLEGTFAASWDGGTVHWINDCHGDTYSLHAEGDVIYQAGHTHYCENIDGLRQGDGGVGDYPYYRGTAMSRAATGTVTWEPDQGHYSNFAGQPAPSLLTWFPHFAAGSYTGQLQGPWSVAGNDDYVVMGGEFTRVNGRSQQGLVRFATSDIAPDAEGPRLYNDTYPITVSSSEPGTVRINWRANYDRDNDYLEYRLYRDAETRENRIDTRTVRADFWNLYTMGFTDTGLEPGSTHRYRVKVYDAFGNVANSPWVDVTVATSGTVSDYVRAVLDSEPEHFWRLGEPDGTVVRDTIGFGDAAAGSGVTRGVPGATSGDADAASHFDGTSDGYAATSAIENPVDVFTLEAWFRTRSGRGGKIVGWGREGTPWKFDRHVYLDHAGHVLFAVKPDLNRVAIGSNETYNDGQWHQVTASLGPDGMRLYVDGRQVAGRAGVVNGESLSLGSWWIGGGGRRAMFDGAVRSAFFTGDIDDVAVYKTVLTDAEVAAHYAAAEPATVPPNRAPVARAMQVTTTANHSVRTRLRARDADGDTLTYRFRRLHGAHISGDGPAVRYRPKRGFVGRTSFRYVATDPSGASDGGRVVVRVRRIDSHVRRVRVRPDIVRAGTRARVRVTVRAGGRAAHGVVVVRERGRWLGRDDLNRYGKARVHLRRMHAGRHRLTVRYRGTRTVQPDVKRITVRVVRARRS